MTINRITRCLFTRQHGSQLQRCCLPRVSSVTLKPAKSSIRCDIRQFHSSHVNNRVNLNNDLTKQSPLAGIRILDFSRIIAGPFATMMLSDLGAEVWKIENIDGGDESRNFKPPEINGESCYFLAFNRNKKSLAIDIKSARGKAIIFELIKKCDVLVENFMPGTMDKLGFGYDDVKRFAPHVIYTSISGYGPDGPWARRGGFDVIAAALGGLLNVTGPMGGEPVKAGIAVTDLMTAQYAHGAVMAALLLREKTGEGQKIDCSLLATQIATLTNLGSGYLNTGVEPRKWGTDHETVVPYRGFRTKDDRWLVIGAGNNKLWAQFCHLISMPELTEVPEYKTNPDRVKNRVKLTKILEDRFTELTLQEWTAIFSKSTLPFGPVNNMKEAFAHPQVLHSGIVQEVDHPTAGNVKITGPPVRYTEACNAIRSAPPLLGEHTREVLREILNIDDEEIELMRAAKEVDYPMKK